MFTPIQGEAGFLSEPSRLISFLSLQVNSSDLPAFQEKYSVILRTSFAGFLKKRDKAKERRVDKLLKEKRKRMEEASKVKVTSIGSSEFTSDLGHPSDK